MPALLLVSHGSVRRGAGASLEEQLARLLKLGEWDRVEAGYLNYNRPTVQEALGDLARAGCKEVVAVPYFLVPGRFVQAAVPQQIALAAARHPRLELRQAEPIGYDAELAPMLEDLARESAGERSGDTALLVTAHGSPEEGANEPVRLVVEDLQSTGRWLEVSGAFLECAAPSIEEEAVRLVQGGARRVVLAPFFLHPGRHVEEDLPAMRDLLAGRLPHAAFLLARHIGSHERIASIIRERARAASGRAPILPRGGRRRPVE